MFHLNQIRQSSLLYIEKDVYKNIIIYTIKYSFKKYL
jgi:hypothetical protein